METREILNISRKLLNLNLINVEECSTMRKKDFADIYDLIVYLEHNLELNLEELDLLRLLED